MGDTTENGSVGNLKTDHESFGDWDSDIEDDDPSLESSCRSDGIDSTGKYTPDAKI